MATATKENLKQDKAQRFAMQSAVNTMMRDFSFKKVKTWGDAYRAIGYPTSWISQQTNNQELIDFPTCKSFGLKVMEDLEKRLQAKYEVKQSIPSSSEAGNIKEQSTVHQEPNNNKVSRIETVSSGKETMVVDDKGGTVDESSFLNTNDYGLQPSERENAFLFWFQKKAVKECYDKVTTEMKRAVLLLASTGTGKTYMQGALDRRLQDIKFADGKTWGHIKYLAITRNSVVAQTGRVLKDMFNINPVTETEVLNIEKLRTRAAQIWLESGTTVVDGDEVEFWKWKNLINPAVVYLDECQSVKNPDSTQSKIITAYSELPNTTQVYISATPFTRVSEAKAFAIATKKDISNITGIEGSILDAATWPTYSKAISHPSPPDEYNEAAVDRLMDDLKDYIVRVKGVRWQFNAKNSVEIIDFETEEQRKEYSDAWNKYQDKMAKLEMAISDNPRLLAMIALGQFLIAAEYAKREIFARRMYQDVQNGYAAVCAVKNKKTIVAVVKILIEKYGVSRDKISLIWGGGQTALTAKQKLKNQIKANKDKFDEAGISMADLQLEEVEDREIEQFDPEYRLGIQSKQQRQEEIDKFQSGRSLYCMYTYKAGGVGLSLHHTDEQCNDWNRNVEGFAEWYEMIQKRNATAEIFNKGLVERNKKLVAEKKWPIAKAQVVKPGKVRRKENGYFMEEDIKYVLTRPRKVTVGPTWSPIELVQGCGRAPRLTSLSDTIQQFLYFRGTVEEEQAFVVTHRLKCLSRVVRQHENWQDLITNHARAKEIARARVEETKQYESDEPQTEIAINNEEEDDE